MESTYPPHLQRMFEEEVELKDKVDKLNAFVNDVKKFNSLDIHAQRLLLTQRTYMKAYLDVLQKRIKHAKGKHA